MIKQATGHKRVTIADIAKAVGVSKGAVSYALNDKPGISDKTRKKILAKAEQLGWYPNSAARALSAAKANACGLVLSRPARTLAFEPFFMQLIAGVESELSARSIALAIQVVDSVELEMQVYKRWWAERRVDGVLVVDIRENDPRIEFLAELGLPALVVGPPLKNHEIPALWHDEYGVMEEVVRYLHALGHQYIARVAGVPGFLHTVTRTKSFLETAKELKMKSKVLTTDFMPESGAQATRKLLTMTEPPTAVIYDSDILAVAGLGVAHEMGLSIPQDLSIVAWDDSTFCQLVHPPLTAISRDIHSYGATACRKLLDIIDSNDMTDEESPSGKLIPRASTGRHQEAL
jgi:DNA-binding LacI/PurR family transcriptional regulator